MHLLVPAQIADDGEMAAASFNVARERLLAGVTVHVSLERAWSSEALVTNFTFVLLLRVS